MDNAHLTALTAKHAGIESRISSELQRPLPDRSLIVTLKKQKLKLKEAILIH